MRRLVVGGFSALLLAALLAAGLAWNDYQNWLERPLSYEGPVEFTVAPGSSFRDVSRQLTEAGILDREQAFELQARLSGEAGKLKAGEYLLEDGLSPVGILARLVGGRVRLYTFTIIDGWTVHELLTALAGADDVIRTLEFTDTWDPAFQETLAVELELDYPHPEGLFFPETYSFPAGTTDVDLLRMSADLMKTELASAWEQRAEDQQLSTPYELLTLASIIQRETGRDDERQQVSGVFHRRLARPMRLQTDPTVIYGLGASFDGNIRREDLTADTPYNTYTRDGLPPTPISLPGRAALLAAGQPDDGDTLYFVATGEGDGSHYFSRTLSEHNAAVARYLKRLRQQRN